VLGNGNGDTTSDLFRFPNPDEEWRFDIIYDRTFTPPVLSAQTVVLVEKDAGADAPITSRMVELGSGKTLHIDFGVDCLVPYTWDETGFLQDAHLRSEGLFFVAYFYADYTEETRCELALNTHVVYDDL